MGDDTASAGASELLRRRARVRFSAAALGVLVAGLAGYVAFVGFVGPDREIAAGTMFLAAATGFVAFFSPCSFPLLLTFLSRAATQSRRAVVRSALAVGMGATALLALIALLIVFGGEAIGRVVEFDSPAGRAFRVTVGLLLLVLGLRQTHWLPVRMRWLDGVAGAAARMFDPSRPSNRISGDFVYGFGYLLAGFG
jgi:cytochrome c biogenesis protein CcdA